jgi:hypothetical protein
MNRQTSVVVPEITPRVDIEKTYRQLMRLRRMVKQAESLQGRLGEKPRGAGMSVLSLTTAFDCGSARNGKHFEHERQKPRSGGKIPAASSR